MGTIRKYGLMFVLLLVMGFIFVMPDFLLRFIPTFTGNPLDTVVISILSIMIIVFWKG